MQKDFMTEFYNNHSCDNNSHHDISPSHPCVCGNDGTDCFDESHSSEFQELLFDFATTMFENGDRFTNVPFDVDNWTTDFWPKYRNDGKTREYRLRFGNTSAGMITIPPKGNRWEYRPDCLAAITIEIDERELDGYVMDWESDRICFDLISTTKY